MLDQLLEWIVIILPVLFAFGVEVMDEKARKRGTWRISVLCLGMFMSALVWWQQSRAVTQAKKDRTEVIQNTSEKVAGKVTGILNKEYGALIGSLYREIGSLTAQVQGQSTLRKEEMALNYMPALDLIYAGSQLQLWNHGKSSISLWGDKYGDTLSSMNTGPIVISPAAYYYFLTEALVANITATLGKNGEARVPFEIYIVTVDNAKYVVHYELWEVIKDGQLTIHTQNHGFSKQDWSK